ncbi:YopX family protein [Bacillus inaquosorum]|uniref:YopX family protein n=1 Tax=Bacillus inaquosorum TaxID=483913 RepID=UPI0022819E3B|nr:YopX family protein [Bacillus inaquosorum]MCY8704991.1 YopX family protein [Bacillus inaquosorum]
MREIKFRGMGINGEWYTGNLSIIKQRIKSMGIDPGSYISNKAGVPFAYKVRPETVGQFTGLKDANGREIYEGDHLFSKGNMDGIDYVGTVTYCENDAKYILENLHGRLEWIPNNECWVKGNIYENPELLEASHASK